MVVRLVQLRNAPRPIEVTECGILIDASFEQYEKVLSPIHVTEYGIVIDVRLEHPKNA
jgi:hypothetical protein